MSLSCIILKYYYISIFLSSFRITWLHKLPYSVTRPRILMCYITICAFMALVSSSLWASSSTSASSPWAKPLRLSSSASSFPSYASGSALDSTGTAPTSSGKQWRLVSEITTTRLSEKKRKNYSTKLHARVRRRYTAAVTLVLSSLDRFRPGQSVPTRLFLGDVITTSNSHHSSSCL